MKRAWAKSTKGGVIGLQVPIEGLIRMEGGLDLIRDEPFNSNLKLSLKL